MIIGAAVDFSMQVANGENVVDATIKTGAHVAIGMKAAAIGTAIGGPIGTVVGFGLGVLGSMAFDWVYDNKEEIASVVVDTVSDGIETVGDAISDIGKGIASIFG